MANKEFATGSKQPLKYVEIPLTKFSEEVIPHHQRIFEQHKLYIYKLISLSNAEQLCRETKEKKRVVKQLKDLMYELDTLRTQVDDEDLDEFDSKTLSLRKIILTLISGYGDLEKSANKIINPCSGHDEDENKENVGNPFAGASQIQIQGNLNDLKLKEQQNRLNRVEDIHRDVEDLHEMYQDLNEMVHHQSEFVENVEENVESTQENVDMGVKSIVSAHRMKAVAYPATGALLGGIIGGPIGLLAGAKIGGITAIGCATVGYIGAKFFKKVNDPDHITREELAVEKENPTELEKKDI